MIISPQTNPILFSPTLSHDAGSAFNEQQSGRRQSIPPVQKAVASERSTDKSAGEDSERAAKQKTSNKVEVLENQRDQATIEALKSRDREVRAHEAAHAAVGGQFAGAPTYTFQRGPNGVSYAVGGEVSISTSEIAGDPEATLQKALQVQRAALAPAEPSAQDRKVAGQAAQMAVQARIDIAELEAEGLGETRINKSQDHAETSDMAGSSDSDEDNLDRSKPVGNGQGQLVPEPGQLIDLLV